MASTDSTTDSRSVNKGRYAFVSLGCPKNLVDSERMLGRLQLEGYELVGEPEQADFVVVNTCGFIEAARKESHSAIEEMAELKRRGSVRGLIVAGCLAERDRESLLQRVPEIDALVGVFARDEVTRIADRIVGSVLEQQTIFRPAPVRMQDDRGRLRVTPRHFAYLKISEGCDRTCTFCAIPNMRGKHVSKPIEEIVAEAEQLAGDGVRELILVAQDATYYGIDLYGEPRLSQLLQRLESVEGIDWIRLMYLYPIHFDSELIETIAASSRIIPYLDLPLQHIDDDVLRHMARRVTRHDIETLLAQLRDSIDELVLRTTFLVGFPGETEEQFATLLDFVREARFERIGVFPYSLEPDTPSARMDGHLPEEVKLERRDRLMEVQQEIAFAWAQRQVGRQLDVLIDGPVEDEPTAWLGRTYADAPDIDPVVYVTSQNYPLAPGQLVRCEIVMAREYDLIAVPVEKPR